MPGTIRVKVLGAKDLPIMDRSAETTDAFVEIRFASTSFKTEVCPRTLHPRWDTDWFVFEAEDHDLQDECLQLRIMDYDTYSANDAIGRIYVDLNPLVEAANRLEREKKSVSDTQLQPDSCDIADSEFPPSFRPFFSQAAEMKGWLPIMDTLIGIRGELEFVVRLELFADVSVFRQSSCGVQLFSSQVVPTGFKVSAVHGFVDELLVCTDPEHQWLDKIRTPRTTNEARQSILRRISSELSRKIGRKALQLGANCILGYRLCFDVEGPSTSLLVVRGYGTAVSVVDIRRPPEQRPGVSPDYINGEENGICTSTENSRIELLRNVSESCSSGSDRSRHRSDRSAERSATQENSTTSTPARAAECPEHISAGADSSRLATQRLHSEPANSASLSTPSVHFESPDHSAPPTRKQSRSSKPMLRQLTVPDQILSCGEAQFPAHSPGIMTDHLMDSESAFPMLTGSRDSFHRLPDNLPLLRSPGGGLCGAVGFPPGAERGPELPLLTLESLPEGVLTGFGGVVCARSVKLLEDVEDKDETEAAVIRSGWWLELRQEIRSHMKALTCNAVIAYKEEISIKEGICIMSSSATAVRVDASLWTSELNTANAKGALSSRVSYTEPTDADLLTPVAEEENSDSIAHSTSDTLVHATERRVSTTIPPPRSTERRISVGRMQNVPSVECAFCHVAYSGSGPFPMSLSVCSICGEHRVPDLVMATCDPPQELVDHSAGVEPRLIQVPIIRRLEEDGHEDLAKEISDLLPFLEHQLHTGIVAELQTAGSKRNAVFGLKVSLNIGDRLFVAVATGLAVRLTPLSNLSEDQQMPTPRQSEPDLLDLNSDKSATYVVIGRNSSSNSFMLSRSSKSVSRSPSASAMQYESSHSSSVSLKINKYNNAVSLPDELMLGTWTGIAEESIVGASGSETTDQDDRTKIERFKDFFGRKHKKTDPNELFLRHIAVSVGLLEDSALSDNVLKVGLCGLVLNCAQLASRAGKDGENLFAVTSTSTDPLNRSVFLSIKTADTLFDLQREELSLRYLGHFDLSFIRESTSVKEMGGLDAFVKLSAAEVFHSVRSQVRAFGGNGLCSLKMTIAQLTASTTKNQAQFVFGVLGDIVRLRRSSIGTQDSEE